MEIPVGTALIVGSVILLIGLLLIAVQAFKKSILWGLAVLLIPFAALVFVVRYWQEGRNGFLVSVVGLLISAISLYGGAEKEMQLEKHLDKAIETTGVDVSKIPVPEKATEAVSDLLEKRPGNVEIPNQAAAEAAGIDTEKDIYAIEAEEEEEVIIEPLSPEPQVPSPIAGLKTVKMSLQPVSRSRLPDYIGNTLRVHLLGGEVEEGVLDSLSSTGDSLSLRQRVSAGEITYEYPFSKIEWIEVYAEAGTVPAPEEEVPAPTEVTPRFVPKEQLEQQSAADAPAASTEQTETFEQPVTEVPAAVKE
jgi:hypothetical protein